MLLNDAGNIVETEWRSLPQRFPGIQTDAFVVMPNHIHGVILVGARFIAPMRVNPGTINRNEGTINRNEGTINRNEGAINRNEGAINRNEGAINRAPTLGDIVRAFKAVTSRRIRQQGSTAFAWQRNYYEHIIRNEQTLVRVREYIANNPRQWALDSENPAVGSRWMAPGSGER
ncbi:hypothetical protein TDMWS_14630 [Thermodesulfomicrobium sp. WS]|nr:hypothetical protein TDMWS_14630 [Thermodesulfomicrobium sp. WS]